MSGARRTNTADREQVILVGSLVGAALLAVVILWVTLHAGAALDRQPTPPRNPVRLVAGLARGDVPWPPLGVILLVAQVTIVAVVAITGVLLWRRIHGRRLRGDAAAALMGTGGDVAVISRSSATATATRLGIDPATPGLRIARTVRGGQTLWQGWEDVAVDIWGPRQGKTIRRVIPAVVEAPGAVLVTSNKRDVLDATRLVREQVGPVWVFDPQHLAGEQPTWWWNPISYVTDEVSAQKLASVLITAARPAEARLDAFFDTAGEELLAGMLLAASVGRRSLTDVYLWLTRPTDPEPAILLDDAGHHLTAASVRNHIDAPDKQRDGVFGTARTMARFMTNTAAMRWVTPSGGARRPTLDPAAFVRDPTATLYLLSREGEGSTGPIMTALTVAIAEAAEAYSQTCSHGRLPVPLVMALDEAANICRWRELPNLYSHFGSRGICVMTMLQSWSQGEDVWGQAGMTKLWSAATVRVIGSGVGGGGFLSDLSALIGEWDAPTRSHNTGSGHGTRSSYTYSRQRERIMDVADIAALPRGRAIVMAAGARPALCRTVPWMEGQHAQAIQQSLATYAPTPATPALADTTTRSTR